MAEEHDEHPEKPASDEHSENTDTTPAGYPPGQHPNSLANLRPWEPGQSGNPKGRPKKRTLTDELSALAEEVISNGHAEDGMTRNQMVAKALFQILVTGLAGRELKTDVFDRIFNRIAPAPSRAIQVPQDDEDMVIIRLPFEAPEPEIEQKDPDPDI